MRLLRSVLFIFALVIAGAFYTPNVHAEMVCPDGTGECPDGTCAPIGNVCCPNGGSCEAGNRCTSGGGCAPENTQECENNSHAPLDAVCCPGGGYCEAGNRCTSGGGCAPVNTQDCGNGIFAPIGNVCCPSGGSCEAGNRCTSSGGCAPLGTIDCGGGEYCNADSICGTGSECVPKSSPRVCSNGTSYCEAGSVCNGNGNCEIAQSEIPGPPAPPEIDWNQFIPPPSPPPEPSPPKQEPLVEPSDEDPPPQETAEPQPEEKKEPPLPPVVELNVKGMTIPSGEGTGSLSCSSISGLPGDSGGSTGGDCAGKAKWTKTEPYNHAKQPIYFKPYYGNPVDILQGQSLWSIPDTTVPTGRRLKGEAWNEQPHVGKPNCAIEHLNATTRKFQVNIECESKRQLALEEEFEQTFLLREEKAENKYRDYDDCKSPWKVKENPGWKNRSLSWWKQHPGQPTGWCVKGNEHYPLRQKHWHSIKDCEMLGKFLNWGALTINARGVRGCKDKD